MVLVLRLQGLNIEAGPEDIRTFFHGLEILNGGVQITGGQTGEAFIIFKTEKDGHLGLQRSEQVLKGSPVTLCMSSLEELTQKMKVMVKRWKSPAVENEHAAQAPTKELCTALLLGAVAAIKSLQSNNQANQDRSLLVKSPDSPKKTNHVDQQGSPILKEPDMRHDGESPKGPSSSRSKPGYLRLYGLPSSITELEVRNFLEGSLVEEVIVNAFHSPDRCSLVKMTSFEEAEKALKDAKSSFTDFKVKVRLAHERMWTNAKEGRGNSPCSSVVGQKRISPGSPHSLNAPVKRHRSLSGSPKPCRPEAPFGTEYCVMVKNLPTSVTKTELKALFSCPTIPKHKVQHLLNKWKKRTSTAFMIFTRPEDYASAMNMNGSRFNSRTIEVSSITMDKMKDLIRQNRFIEPSTSPLYEGDQASSGLSCIYARNFPADIKRSDVKDFFGTYDLGDHDIELLSDENGNGIGEAVVRFGGSEERARKACGLRGKLFMGEPILLKCISPQQMNEVLKKPQ